MVGGVLLGNKAGPDKTEKIREFFTFLPEPQYCDNDILILAGPGGGGEGGRKYVRNVQSRLPDSLKDNMNLLQRTKKNIHEFYSGFCTELNILY